MAKVYVYRDTSYAPCGFLLVKEGGNPRNDADTVLFQSDWDFPALASNLGFVPCVCGRTDGTVKCPHKEPVEMISAAYDFLVNHQEEPFEDPGYFPVKE
jgi:hypothetical protein